MEIIIEIKGTAPLLMHNIQLANPLHPIVRQMKSISSKRKKTDSDFEQLARLEFEGGLYIDPTVGPYMPGVNVEKCMVEGARITKQGKQIERGLLVTDDQIPFLYPGPRDAAGLYANVEFVNVAAVRVGQSRVMRTRPMFRQWSLEAHAQLAEDLLNLDQFQEIADAAGSMVGLGDGRPRFGRFTARVSKT